MKRIEIELQKHAFLPGEIVEGYVKLDIDNPVKARAIKLEIIGAEETQIPQGADKSSSSSREFYHIIKRDIILHNPLFEENLELEPGNYAFKFEFVMPENALPSYEGQNASITYFLKGRVDVPFWLDMVDKISIFVFRDREALKLLRKPVQFMSDNYSKPYDKKPSFYVELSKTGYIAGEIIEGTVTLRNLTGSNLRKINVRLLGVEFSRASGYRTEVTQSKKEIEIPVNDMIEGIPKLFFLPIPRNAPSSYEGIYSNFRWGVEVKLDIPLGFDVKALHPVEILQ